MPFPVPSPEEITRRIEARMSASLAKIAEAKGLPVSPLAIERAVRSPRGVIAALIRVFSAMIYELHLHLRWWGEQYFPDTAEEEYLRRHASIWGIYQRAATRAVGRAIFEGAAGIVIPVGFELTSASGALVRTTESGAMGEDKALSLAIEAVETGTDGNAVAGERLTIVSPLVGLTLALLDEGGLAGGAAIESVASLRDRVIEKIRQPAHGGADFDYSTWIRNKFATAKVSVVPDWTGRGSVGVIVVMDSVAVPRQPTAVELAAMQAYVNEVKPVTAEVFVVPANIVETPVAIALQPDTTAIRRAVSTAVATFFAREAAIGGTIYKSRLSEAISSASGEYSHTLVMPADNVSFDRHVYPVPGMIDWGDAP